MTSSTSPATNPRTAGDPTGTGTAPDIDPPALRHRKNRP